MHVHVNRTPSDTMGAWNRWTPLAHAAWFEHIETIRTLIDHGAAVGIVDPVGKTATDWPRGRGGVPRGA
jgi:hypothetical protein